MNPLIHRQVYDVVVMLYAGMTVMFFYQLLGFYRSRRPMKGMLHGSLELAFWIFASFVTCAFLYYCCYGQLSIHSFAALFCGMALWRFCVGKKFSIFIRHLYGIIKDTTKILRG